MGRLLGAVLMWAGGLASTACGLLECYFFTRSILNPEPFDHWSRMGYAMVPLACGFLLICVIGLAIKWAAEDW